MRTGPRHTRPRDKALKALIRRAGSISALGRAVGVERQAASQWLKVPERHIKALSQAFPEAPK